jgi:hypothetical protein
MSCNSSIGAGMAKKYHGMASAGGIVSVPQAWTVSREGVASA